MTCSYDIVVYPVQYTFLRLQRRDGVVAGKGSHMQTVREVQGKYRPRQAGQDRHTIAGCAPGPGRPE